MPGFNFYVVPFPTREYTAPMADIDPGTPAPSQALSGALRHLLRPLVRFLIARGIAFPYVSELLKSVYVEIAARDFALGGRRQTDSRVTLLTGVHRKDVKRLSRSLGQSGQVMPESVSLGARLVVAWTSSQEFLARDGTPLPLPKRASGGGEVSFEGLVASVSKDIRSRAVLDEWLRLGVVELNERDEVCLKVEAFVPEEGIEEKTFYFGHNLHDHLAAATHNVLGIKPAFLERSVHYDALAKDSVAELAAWSEKAGMEAAKAINKQAMKLERRDKADGSPRQRITFGIYFYSEPVDRDRDDGGSK